MGTYRIITLKRAPLVRDGNDLEIVIVKDMTMFKMLQETNIKIHKQRDNILT
jgi:hypothetical protein